MRALLACKVFILNKLWWTSQSSAGVFGNGAYVQKLAAKKPQFPAIGHFLPGFPQVSTQGPVLSADMLFAQFDG
jgi:hypothetical protein